MSNVRQLPDKEFNRLLELVNQDINPNKINKIFEEEFGKGIPYGTVLNKVKILFSKQWNSKAKSYVIISEDNPQCSMMEGDAYNYNNINKTNDITNSEGFKNMDTDILSYLKSIDKNIALLNTRLTKLEGYIEKNSPQAKKDLVNSFIDIYSSSKDRDSVNINSELKKRDIEKMAQNKNIHGNHSHAINTALLIALFED